jgi:membrane-bound lytic murein transglycosylase B
MKIIAKIILCLIIAVALGGVFSDTGAQSAIEKKKQEIVTLEKDINNKQSEIQKRENQEFTYTNHLETLQTKLARNREEQQLVTDKIELTTLEIQAIEDDIGDTKKSLTHQQTILGGYLRELGRYDRANKMLLLLNADSLTKFYNQVNYTENISGKTFDLVEKITLQKTDLEEQREYLVNKKMEQETLRYDLRIFESEVKRAQAELDLMRQRNSEEIKSLADTVSQTEEIRTQLQQELFALTREGQSIQFQEAAAYANFAYAQTGVRPELIMSIIKQETNFGNNVGNGTYKQDMKPDQWETFIQICKELGRSPENTPVSAQPSYGWGGAMGIAQFLPKTWLTVNNEVSQITGNRPANPWDPQDAFVAVGVKLQKMGAAGGNRDKEWEAAGRYFAGGNYQRFPWYADNVLERATKYKDMLKSL